MIDRMTTDPAQAAFPHLDVAVSSFDEHPPEVTKLPQVGALLDPDTEKILAMRPDLVIRSTFIAGFPGETEAEFGELLAFLEAAQLDRVGCFAYSPVDGAAANALPDPVPAEVREDRRARFMAVQEKISARRLARHVGSTITVLVDGHEGEAAMARSAADAPEIDGIVRIAGGNRLAIGDFARVTVTGASGHDLYARKWHKSAKRVSAPDVALAPLVAATMVGLFALIALSAGLVFNIVTVALPKIVDERLGLDLSLVLVGGCSKDDRKDASRPPLEVTALTIVPRDVPVSSVFVAQTQSSQAVNIAARVSGFLDKRVYTEGAVVKAGQVLFRMDQKPFQAQVDGQAAALQRNQAALSRPANLAQALTNRTLVAEGLTTRGGIRAGAGRRRAGQGPARGGEAQPIVHGHRIARRRRQQLRSGGRRHLCQPAEQPAHHHLGADADVDQLQHLRERDAAHPEPGPARADPAA